MDYSKQEKQIINMYFLEGINVSRIASITSNKKEYVRNILQRFQLQILEYQQTDDYKKAVEILYK